MTAQATVRREPLFDDDAGPDFGLRLEPAGEPIEAATWIAAHRGALAGWLAARGAVLLRGFAAAGAADLEAALSAGWGPLLAYTERTSPRTRIAGNVYTSTEHPADQAIYVHNEQAYNLRFPAVIAFHCLAPATTGGATPLADCRAVHDRLTPALVARLIARRYRYQRSFTPPIGLSWQEAFQVDDRAACEAYCRAHQIELVWRGRGARTYQIRDLVVRHPDTGARAWTNHLTFFHVSTLAPDIRAVVEAAFGPDDLPNLTCYGDGAPIEAGVLDELRAAYAAATRRFTWQRGDLLLIDNRIVAHGRDRFTGARRVLVAMAAPTGWAELGVRDGAG